MAPRARRASQVLPDSPSRVQVRHHLELSLKHKPPISGPGSAAYVVVATEPHLAVILEGSHECSAEVLLQL